MTLSRDVFLELEDVLGPENITHDLTVRDGYAYLGLLAPNSTDPRDRYLLRPAAIALPGSAEEVQTVIKLCNRRGITSKAACTAYGGHNAVGSEDVIFLDLRRMNRILDIDARNMLVIVEPYVSFAQVQAEAMKMGLNCGIVGGGSQVSFLASHTSMDGNNTQAISQGFAGRNLLGVEWVLPTGELIRLGSPGSGAGWFSGDGPGPSLRGIMRGYRGAMGGLGVFTKCACHLHPWPGPRRMEIKGVSPYYEVEPPPLFEYHLLEWPTWKQCAEANYRIGEAGIAYALHKAGGPGSHGAIVTTSNNEYWEKRQAGELKIPRISFAIVLAANSAGEHEYQVEVLNMILKETEGRISQVGEDPQFKNRDFLHMIKTCFTPRLAFRPTGSFFVNGLIGTESMDNVALGLEKDDELRDKYAEKGLIMDDGTSNGWAVSFENTHFSLIECGHPFCATVDESRKGILQMLKEGREISLNLPLSMSWAAMGHDKGIGNKTTVTMVGPICHNYHNWMRKIKKEFDPKTVSDPSCYMSAEEG